MQFLGSVRRKEDAIYQAKIIADRENRPVVIEKAKFRGNDGRRLACWRGWLDMRGDYTGTKDRSIWFLRRDGTEKHLTRVE